MREQIILDVITLGANNCLSLNSTKLIQQIKNLCCFYQQIKLFRIYLLYLGFMSNSEGVFIISRMLVSAKFDVDLVDKLKVADSTSLYQVVSELKFNLIKAE